MRHGAGTALVAASLVVAFTFAQQPEFLVASIKENSLAAQKKPGPTTLGTDVGGVLEPPRGNRVMTRGTSVRMLVRYAYGELGSNGEIVRPIEAARVLGGPDWIDSRLFDIDARMDSASRGPLERAAMMRGLLEERFSLRTHRETRELPVYHLVFARDDRRPGPRLRELSAACTPTGSVPDREIPCATRTAPGSISGHGIAMGALATYLSPVVGRIVLDRTGLTGRFDVELTFAIANDAGTPGAKAAFPGDAPAIFAAVQEQLGLRLVAARSPVDVIVIDRVAPPTDN